LLAQYDTTPEKPLVGSRFGYGGGLQGLVRDTSAGIRPYKHTKGETTMRKFILGGFAAATVALGVGLASPASATMATIGERGDYNPYNYRDELRYTGLNHEDVYNASSLGPRVCVRRQMGYTEEQLVSSLDDGPDYTAEQAVEIVMGGEYHFCPSYMDDGSIGTGSRWYGGPIL